MAAVSFTCPRCCGVFQVASTLAGQQVACPHCRSLVTLPAAGTAARPLPLPAPPPSSGPPSPPSPPANAGRAAIDVRPPRSGTRARRRLLRNLLLWGFGLGIIGLVMAILLIVGPVRKK